MSVFLYWSSHLYIQKVVAILFSELRVVNLSPEGQGISGVSFADGKVSVVHCQPSWCSSIALKTICEPRGDAVFFKPITKVDSKVGLVNSMHIICWYPRRSCGKVFWSEHSIHQGRHEKIMSWLMNLKNERSCATDFSYLENCYWDNFKKIILKTKQ